MYRYKYNTSYHHKSRRAKRTTVLAVFATTFVVIAMIVIAVDIYFQTVKKEQPISQAVNSSVQGASINLFRTEYFQFQANSSWKEIPSESKKDHFVYRSYNGPLVEHDLVIDVNKTTEEVLPNIKTTRVMPVQIESNGRLTIMGGAGEHCKTLMPKDAAPIPTRVTQRQVGFVCSVDAIIYEVKVGVVGGSTDMLIPRPDGTSAHYVLTYRNLRFTPDDTLLRDIISTFQTR